MLHIAFTILRIIGIILLAILGILVLFICIVLFTPLRYQIAAQADGEVKSIKANIRFSWFIHIISGHVSYEDKKMDFQIKLFGRRINLDNLTKKEESKEKDEEAESAAFEKTDVIRHQSSESVKEENTPLIEEKKPETSNEKKSTKKNVHKKKQNILERIKYTIGSICDKIRALKQKADEVTTFIKDEIHKAAFKRVLNEILRLLRFLKPKRFQLNLNFGFEDPAQTGQVLGVISMLYPFLEKNIDITPDFQNQIIKGDVYIKGHFRCVYVLILGFNLLFDKNIRMTLKDIKKFMANL